MARREYTSTSSTRVVTPATGALVSELRYSAYGEQRFASGASPTDYRYTGQLSKIATVGLYHYGARWFDPQLAPGFLGVPSCPSGDLPVFFHVS